MLRSLLFSLLMIFFCASVISQDRWIDTEASPVESIERLILPLLDNEKLKDKYGFYEETTERLPHIFAEAVNTNINTNSHGSWESTQNGHLLWRQRIVSKNAYSLNLGFTDFHLPPSASLFLSNVSRSYVIGPITQNENDLHREWWSPVLEGDDIIIELQIHPDEVEELKLELTKVNHDFSGLGAIVSGSCNLDVICGENDGFDIVEKYRDIINGVGAMIIQGRFQCTGWLVNNTRQDCTPYVVTAEHCGITESSAASVVIYWNYQNSQCRAPNSIASGSNGDGRLSEFNSGSKLIAQFDQTDFSLIELDDSVDPATNPYFNGWDRITEQVDSALTIHHPAGEEKRISIDYDQLLFNVDRNYVRVADWDIGSTEGGSSGAPLFNKNGLVVGYLSGGDASCSNNLEDDFGMFKMSWEGGGTPETRLKDWLDPINSGVESMTGRYCTDVAVLSSEVISLCSSASSSTEVFLTARTGYTDSGIISIEDSSQGLEVSLSATSISTDETVSIMIAVTDEFIGTSGQIKIRVENDLGPTEFDIEVLVYEQIPAQVVPILPPLNATGLDFDIFFEWSETAPQYLLEISENPSFSGPIRTEDMITSASISLRNFESSTTYFWRVKALNACGESGYSLVSSFTTGSIICQDSNPIDLPQTISFDPDTVMSTINILETGSLADVNVKDITGSHTWIRDLTFLLTSPSGTTIVLVETPCDDEDNFRVSFDDDSPNINLDCPLTTGRAFKPVEALSAFIGEEASGLWTLTIIDGVGDDGGQFDDWTLELCINKSNSKKINVDPTFLEVCDKDPESVDMTISLDGNWNNPQNLTVTTGSGMPIAATYIPNPIGTSSDVNVTLTEPSLLIGQNSITISVLDEGIELNTEVSIIHTSMVVEPELINPSDMEEQVDLTPTLTWTSGASQNNDLHHILVAKDETLSDVIFDQEVEGDSIEITENLEELTTFYWQVTALGSCSDRSSTVHSFTTDKKTATIDLRFSSVKLFPSPVRDMLSIDLGNIDNSGDLYVELISLSGKTLVQKKIKERISQLRTTDIPSGLYLVHFVSSQGAYTRKIVVDR